MADLETDIHFSQLGLGSVLKQNKLVVPPNQREYAWTDKEVPTLFRDFARAIAEGDRSYFLGTIVTIPRAGDVLEVSDGQQRLATTAILLSAIRDYLTEREPAIAEAITGEFLTVIERSSRERIPRLKLNLDDNDYFRARLNGDQPEPEATKPSHHLIDDAFKEARAQVRSIVASHDENIHGDILNQWIDFIESKAIVVLLRVQNEANAYRMFETLNDRGLRTSQSDLVKNYLFGRAGERLPEVQQKWAFMRVALESMEEDDMTILFLRHALIIIRGFLRETQVYDVVQTHAKAAQPVVTFASSLELLASTYVAIHSSEHERWNAHTQETRRAIEVLNLFGIRPMRPLMLAIAQKFAGKDDAEKSFKLLVSMGVRLMIAGGTRTGTIEEGLASVAHKVFIDEVGDVEGLQEALKPFIPNNERFQLAFRSATVSNRRLARYYLRSLEMAAKDEAEPWHIPNDDGSVINLEHVLPEKPQGNWPQFNDDEVKLYYRRIGNLALLRATENSDLNSQGFDDKKAVYAESPYVLTQQISEADEWTAESIAERQTTLTRYALQAWPDKWT